MEKKVIVIFDDDVHMAEVLKINLESTIECLGLPYRDARKCLEDIENGLRFDILITDLAVERDSETLVSGNLNGEDIGRKVRELYPQVPIITLSGIRDKPPYSSYHLRKVVTLSEIVDAIRHVS